MLTVVIYVVVTLIVAAALFALSIAVFGRSELLPAVARGRTVTMLPDGPLAGDDLRSVRFGMSARGYTMSEVDWVLEHAAAEIDRLRSRLGEAPVAGTATDTAPDTATDTAPSPSTGTDPDADAGTASHGVGPERAPASRPGVTR